MGVEEERDTQEDARVQERTEMEHEVARRELGEKDAYRHETCGWIGKLQPETHRLSSIHPQTTRCPRAWVVYSSEVSH